MPASRHLHPDTVVGTLARGRAVEQLLAVADGTVSWLAISPRGDGRYVLTRHRVEDIGAADFLDVAEFPPIDEDEELGEGAAVGSFNDPAAAVAAAGDLGALPDRWVNEGLVGDDYGDAHARA